MYSYNLIILNSIAELRNNASDWDELWSRSSVKTPLARAEMIAQWVERFAPKSIFCAIIIKRCNKFVCALPIVGFLKFNIILTGINPSNEWAQSGQLLVDIQEDIFAIFNLLIDGIYKLPFSILWFDYIREEDEEWAIFKSIIRSKQISSHWLSRYPTAVANFSNNFEIDSSFFDKKSLSNIKRIIKKRYFNNDYKFVVASSCEEIQVLLSDCFKIENAGWKGKGKGGSIINRNMQNFVINQALTLCNNREVVLFVLKFEEKIIAFRYALISKGTIFMLKTSYDVFYRSYAPGQVLTYFIVTEYCYENNLKTIDFTGEMLPHQKIWNPDECSNAQFVMPLYSFYGKFFYRIYDFVMPIKRKFTSNYLIFLKNLKNIIFKNV